MTRQFILWALIGSATPLAAFAQASDSIKSIEIEEVVVKANHKIAKADGTGYLPSAEMKRLATSGLNLLQKLHLPHISVNELTGSVNLTGGGDVTLYINSIEATPAEVASLRPADIIRVDYHDSPGVRYGGHPAAVIDFIVKRHSAGGAVSLESMTAVGRGKWASIDNVAGQFSCGRSSFSAQLSFFGLGRDNWVRDYSEQWHYPDRDVVRNETGLPVSIGSSAVQSVLNYSFEADEKTLLNVRAAWNSSHVPNKEEGDRHTLLTTSASATPSEIREHTREHDNSPSVALFFRRNLTSTSSVTANVNLAATHSASHHTYSESAPEAGLFEIVADARADTKSLVAEALYDHRWAPEAGVDQWTLLAGARHTQSYTLDTYTGSSDAEVRFNRAETSVFAEAGCRAGQLMASVSLSANRYITSQRKATKLNDFAVLPALKLSYAPAPMLSLRCGVALDRSRPLLAQMSSVEQTIQPGLLRRGNPDLKSWWTTTSRFSGSLTLNPVSVDVMVSYSHERRPAMGETFFDGSNFVMTYANQRSFRELRTELSVSLKPWADHLTVTLSPSLSRYYSRGNSYSHVRGIFHLGGALEFNYRSFVFNASLMTGAANSMRGEEIIRETDMNMIMAGIRKPKWSVEAGVFNAFMKSYSMTTENMSSAIRYKSKAHCGNNAYGAVRLSVSLDFGRKPVADGGFEEAGIAAPADNGIVNSQR